MRAWAFAADALACTAALAAVAATSLTIARRLGVRGFGDRMLASAVVGAAQIVLTVEALSLLGRIARACVGSARRSPCFASRGTSAHRMVLP